MDALGRTVMGFIPRLTVFSTLALMAISTQAQVNISDIVGLSSSLKTRPVIGPGFAPSRAAVISAAGAIEGVLGPDSYCVRVDGTSQPCGSGAIAAVNGVTFVDNEVPTGTQDSVNTRFTLAHTPSPAESLLLFRNGMLQRNGADYQQSGQTLTFLTCCIPAPSDLLTATYRVATDILTSTNPASKQLGGHLFVRQVTRDQAQEEIFTAPDQSTNSRPSVLTEPDLVLQEEVLRKGLRSLRLLALRTNLAKDPPTPSEVNVSNENKPTTVMGFRKSRGRNEAIVDTYSTLEGGIDMETSSSGSGTAHDDLSSGELSARTFTAGSNNENRKQGDPRSVRMLLNRVRQR